MQLEARVVDMERQLKEAHDAVRTTEIGADAAVKTGMVSKDTWIDSATPPVTPRPSTDAAAVAAVGDGKKLATTFALRSRALIQTTNVAFMGITNISWRKKL